MSSTAYALPAPDLVLDRYRPLRPLGRGGSGSVWLARDERTGLEVALKIVPREGKRASRAAREMEAASRLRHERCVRAYDFGGDSGHVYIAYEYVQGSTLRETLRSGKLGDRDAVEAAAQILDALAHAHRLGIVHRDVKPSNVLVEETPTISIRLLDFGLAQFDEADTLTAVGDVPGTLAYIAPERLRGGDATAASDVWAVGVVLWEALVGEHPFWGVPLPQVAAAIEAGAKPIGSARADLSARRRRRRLVGTDDRARRSVRRRSDSPPPCEPRSTSPRRDRSKSARPRQATAAPKPATVTVPLERRLASRPRSRRSPSPSPPRCCRSGRPGSCSCSRSPPRPQRSRRRASASRSPSSCPSSRSGTSPRRPRSPTARSRSAWLAVFWRDARAGLLFVAGPLLAAVGAIALLPLAVQPARGRARRALQAFAGVLVAAAVAGLRGAAAAAHRLDRPESRRRRLDARHRRGPGDRGRRSATTPGSSSSRVVLALAAASCPTPAGAG